MKRTYSLITLVVLSLAAVNGFAASAPEWLLGTWQLNNELSAEVQVKKKNSSSGGFGGLSSTVSVGGVSIPTPGTSPSQQPPGGSPRDPQVLRCNEMQISIVEEDLLMEFIGVGKERIEYGDNQGRVSKWGRNKMTSRYETTSRKVSRTYQLRKDGTLLVTVKIKPRQAASIVQKRVFERPGGAAAE